jgi:ABC-type multidrug transport system fused ATPase/permease subunit
MKNNRFSNVLPVLKYFYTLAWQYNKPYFLLVAVNMLIRGFSPFINIILPKHIIDELLGQKRVIVIAQFVAAIVLLNFALYLINNLMGYLMNKSRTRLELKFDELLGQKAMTMDFEYTENPEVLNQLEKARTGMSWYSGGIGGLSENLTATVSGVITLAGTLYIIGKLSPWLILILIIVIMINMLVLSKYQKMQTKFMKDLVGVNRKFGYFYNILKNFKYGKDIRMYDASDMLMKRVDQYIDEDWGMEKDRTKKGNRYQILMVFFNVTQQAVLYGYLGLRVLAKAIGIGDFQMLISAANSFTDSLSTILKQTIDIVKNADFMNDYKLFMEYPSKKNSGAHSIKENIQHVFEFRNVSFKYPRSDTYVLKNVSIIIPAGQKLSIVGENGAGKTTFIKLLCRLYDPTEGEIMLDDLNIRNYKHEDYLKFFAVVFQDFKLLAFTIGENISINTMIDNLRIEESITKSGFTKKLHGLDKGIQTCVYKTFDEDGVEFSGGESQKLAIARAVYKNSPIVILDEPTAALDPVAEYDIYNRFDSLIGEKTTIYISHRLSSCRFCDKIAVFHNGELIQHDTHNELVNNNGGKYYEMWNAQAQYYV